MIYGYLRTFFTNQSIDKHRKFLNESGCVEIFQDFQHSTSQLDKVLRKLNSGDELNVIALAHLAKNPKQLHKLLDHFNSRNIVLRTPTFTFDNTELFSRLVDEFVTFNRDVVKQKSLSGLVRAQEKGKRLGKPQGLSEISKLKAKRAYEMRLEGETISKIQNTLSIRSKQTLYSYFRYEAARLKELNPLLELDENGFDFLNYVFRRK